MPSVVRAQAGLQALEDGLSCSLRSEAAVRQPNLSGIPGPSRQRGLSGQVLQQVGRGYGEPGEARLAWRAQERTGTLSKAANCQAGVPLHRADDHAWAAVD
jgi:hypothetical protein